MNVNWNRYIINHLPTRLRNIGLFAFAKVLCSQVVKLYNDYTIFSNKKLKESAYTPQTCMLIKIVHDELGLNIDIVEEDGLYLDFIVKVTTTNLDQERKLTALIDKYKLAGRSFVLNNAAITFETAYSDFVCEIYTIEASWSNFVCELNTIPDCNVRLWDFTGVISISADRKATIHLIVSTLNYITQESHTYYLLYDSSAPYEIQNYGILESEYEQIQDVRLREDMQNSPFNYIFKIEKFNGN